MSKVSFERQWKTLMYHVANAKRSKAKGDRQGLKVDLDQIKGRSINLLYLLGEEDV